MPVKHEPLLVALSLLVAIQGAYVGLSLATQVGAALGLRRRLLLAGAAVSLALAIWAMHFVGMLAARFPFPVDYLVFPTLLSFLVCVMAVGAAVFAVSAGRLTATRLAAAAVFMGGGIATMHYIGMAALHASAHLVHALPFVVASVVVGIAASGLALWLARGSGGRFPLLLSAIAFGLAVSGMHYTAMAGLAVFPLANPPSNAPALSTDLLAIVVAIVAFLVSGIFLLFLVPERPGPQALALAGHAWPNPDSGASDTPEAASPGPGPTDWSAEDGGAELGRGTYAPLGGAGSPPRRLARLLPIEQAGAARFVPVEAIVAIHANAHYTYIFDGKAKLFCPLSIGEVESRLDAGRFVRVHRSHLVNIDRITALRRAGDNGVVELSGDERQTVPVSRSRFNSLKSRLGQRTASSPP